MNETTVEILGVDVGDEISIATMTPEQVRNEEYFPPRGPRLESTSWEWCGVRATWSRAPREVSSPARRSSTPCTARSTSATTYLAVGLTEGATVADFESAIGALIPPGQEYETLSFEARSKAARGNISAVASGLVVFAIVAAVAAVVALGQAVGRHVMSAQADEETLGELGVTRAGRRPRSCCSRFRLRSAVPPWPSSGRGSRRRSCRSVSPGGPSPTPDTPPTGSCWPSAASRWPSSSWSRRPSPLRG